MKATIKMNEWLAALQEVRKPPPPPPGWIAGTDMRSVLGKSAITHTHSAKLARELVAAGAAECCKFPVLCKNGRVVMVPHYRLKKKGKA